MPDSAKISGNIYQILEMNMIQTVSLGLIGNLRNPYQQLLVFQCSTRVVWKLTLGEVHRHVPKPTLDLHLQGRGGSTTFGKVKSA